VVCINWREEIRNKRENDYLATFLSLFCLYSLPACISIGLLDDAVNPVLGFPSGVDNPDK
jgi:hypothetical protein